MKEFDKKLKSWCCCLMAVAYFSALLQHLVLNSGLVCNYSPRQRILNHHHYYHRQHHHRHRHRSLHHHRHHQHHHCYHHHRGRHVIRSRKRKIAEELWMRLNLKCRELWCRSLSSKPISCHQNIHHQLVVLVNKVEQSQKNYYHHLMHNTTHMYISSKPISCHQELGYSILHPQLPYSH